MRTDFRLQRQDYDLSQKRLDPLGETRRPLLEAAVSQLAGDDHARRYVTVADLGETLRADRDFVERSWGIGLRLPISCRQPKPLSSGGPSFCREWWPSEARGADEG